jgi:hypothetical protein
MFKIEKTRPLEPERWQFADREQAIAQARAELLAPGDVVTVKDTGSGDTLWMGVIGRDGSCHEWDGGAPKEVRVTPALAKAA